MAKSDTFYLSLAWIEAFLEQTERYVSAGITTCEKAHEDLKERVVEERRRRAREPWPERKK